MHAMWKQISFVVLSTQVNKWQTATAELDEEGGYRKERICPKLAADCAGQPNRGLRNFIRSVTENHDRWQPQHCDARSFDLNGGAVLR